MTKAHQHRSVMDLVSKTRQHRLAMRGLRPYWVTAVLLTAARLASSLPNVGTAASLSGSAQDIHIPVLSAEPHSISGGDALLRIDVPARVNFRNVRVTLNRQDITS